MENNFSIFARNLDDAELYLPHDVFFKHAPSRFNHHHPFSCMDDLAQRMSALSLPKHMHKPTNFESLKEPVHYGSMNITGLGVNQGLYGLGTGSFLGGAKPVHESYIEARARALQRQQNRLVQNRVLQFKANGFSISKQFGLGGGFGRESGGTGVFHPRIVNTNPNGARFDSKKKQSLRNRQISQKEIEVSSGKINSMKMMNVVKEQEDCYYHLPPEIFA